MRILLVHNSYRQPGGEDVVARAEAALLRTHGHEVDEYWRSNTELGSGLKAAVRSAQAVWSREAVRDIRARVEAFSPDVVHVHNTWLMISPAVYQAARQGRAAVVQTLHNYRLLCPKATMLRNGQPCELCLGKRFPTPGVRHACYRDSRFQTALVGATVGIHRGLGTWDQEVDTYIALTEFAREKFIAGGLPEEKLVVKPNFLQSDPGCGTGNGGYALFVGRLSEEKGLRTLLDAWAKFDMALTLKIVGDGPLADEVAGRAAAHKQIQYMGHATRDEVFGLMQAAALLVLPSLWYEPFGMVLIEAFACGLPVLASRLGSMQELVDEGTNGLLFEPGDARALARQMRWWIEHPARHTAMRQAARATYEEQFTAQSNYRQLMDIYEATLARAGQAATHTTT